MADSLVEELPALQSYFYDLFFIEDFPNKLEVRFSQDVALTIIFPNQNLRTKPKYEVSAPTYSLKFKQKLISLLQDTFKNEDTFSLFTCVKTAYDFLNEEEEVSEKCNSPSSLTHEMEEHKHDEVSRKKSSEKEISSRSINLPTIFSGDPLFDRKSTFQAHVAEIHSKEEAIAVLDKLKENNKIARATHNIYAWSTTIDKNGRKIKAHDCEDDGETGAGPKLAHLMDMMKVDNLIVVVTRWYGGIHLGPDRFRHICNVAREVIEKNITKK